MTVYLDTSVVLRVLFREPRPVHLWGKWDKAYSSALWRVEALRTVDRLRLSGNLSDTEVADLARDIRIVDDTLTIHPIDERILRRASESFSTVVGTLDAIHLATALAVRELENIDLFLTHDLQLGTAARSVGFDVLGME
ncbi:MAG: PIN domain-containing protein [Nitrospirae bacterium]|nr:MAG: PIN domain-containing protein [Nitrospirota bacterium]